jgi:hypothetical protein
MMITYFQNQVITLNYEPEWQLGTATLEGFLSSEEFRQAIRMCAQLMEEKKPLRWLADNRQMKAIRQADQQWFMTYALPKLQASTIRRNATVVSEDIFNKMAVAHIVKRADNLGNMLLQEFSDKQQVLAWLKQPITAAKP